MIHDIFMPALSSTMTEGKIVSWVKSPGDKVVKGETVVVVESDKADMDVESFFDGYLAVIIVNAGEEAPVGAPIALVAETEAEIQQAQAQASSGQASAPAPQEAQPAPEPAMAAFASTPASSNAGSSAPSQTNGRLVASPRAKKLAKELGVDLKTIRGSGPHGRITGEDVEQAVGKAPQPAAQPISAPVSAPTPQPTPQPAPVPAVAAPVSVAPGEVVPFNTLQKAVVQNMMASMQAPMFRVGYTITTDALDDLYKKVKSKGVTMSALLAKAVALSLQKHPVVNASYTEKGIQYNSSINIAVAVAMPDGGLITPVLRNADQTDLYSLSRQWKDLVDRARAKQLQPEEYSTGTFTISNLGMFGVDRFDAILPVGQGSILAIGASRPQVVATPEGLLGVKRQMTVNITCDHRIIYGADAAGFLQDLAKIIETDPQSLTL
ncbi:catalytic domain of components of various dehydrogenase complexes [Gloeothece citriformis PCC 7424]|uniref:Dihydrolipoamide acetyltransferase component of pyruvate dehydrogenase complex n=1 Tax=Gloeothece citriformis (strain PCC 7424) TaxID=65393 RepID=B7KD89_GLOC7|nr:dihydrolipoamide acetyltransferase family protein [Gloeothece citriformis]ACK68909.1 catalytic domain of components of various dehydrogenase complexes [Gloeothece citriformis PCC 7424]